MAYVAVLMPEGEREYNAAFSQAAQLFQERLLSSLANEGVVADGIYVQRPVPSFPAHKRFWYGKSVGTVAEGRFRVVALPFINLGPLKTLTIGTGIFLELLVWGWRHRTESDRLILLYNVSAPPGIVSVLAGWLTRTAVIAVVADIQVPGSGLVGRNLLRRIEYWMQAWVLPRCQGLVVLTREIVRDFAPNARYIQMEGAVPDGGADAPVTLRDVSEAAAPPTWDTPIILMYSGGLSELKGIPLLLEAMGLLETDRFRLWITGDGPLRGLVERACANDARITYWGFAPYAKVCELMGKATVLVNPHSTSLESAHYVFPSKLLEYLATGIPVISTVTTSDMLDEYGPVIFPVLEESPAALAEVVMQVAALPRESLREFGAGARAFVLRNKSWTTQGARIAAFIKVCLGHERGSTAQVNRA